MSSLVKDKCSCNKREFFPSNVKATIGDYERITTFKTGYVCEVPFTQGHSHGQHGMELIFILKGKLGVIQFLIYTNWMPNYGGILDENKFGVIPADIGSHAYKPKYEGQTKREDCFWLDGKPCYYDGSGLQAEEVFKIFVSKGEEAMWRELESYYQSWIVED